MVKHTLAKGTQRVKFESVCKRGEKIDVWQFSDTRHMYGQITKEILSLAQLPMTFRAVSFSLVSSCSTFVSEPIETKPIWPKQSENKPMVVYKLLQITMKSVFAYICISLNETLPFSPLNSIKHCFLGMELKSLVRSDSLPWMIFAASVAWSLIGWPAMLWDKSTHSTVQNFSEISASSRGRVTVMQNYFNKMHQMK